MWFSQRPNKDIENRDKEINAIEEALEKKDRRVKDLENPAKLKDDEYLNLEESCKCRTQSCWFPKEGWKYSGQEGFLWIL